MLDLVSDWKAIGSFKISHKGGNQTSFLDDVPVSMATFQGERDQFRARNILESSVSYFILPE